LVLHNEKSPQYAKIFPNRVSAEIETSTNEMIDCGAVEYKIVACRGFKKRRRLTHSLTGDAQRGGVEAVELGGVRTILGVPMHLERELIGSFTLYHTEVSPFTDKQIALVTNFANQAVIAIENARLNELRGALERQTATAEVLQVISGSPGNLEPVFAAMLENAVRICDAKFGNIYHAEGDGLRIVATHNTPPAFAEARRNLPYFSPGPKNPVRRMMTTRR
jgi:hypothetical protein